MPGGAHRAPHHKYGVTVETLSFYPYRFKSILKEKIWGGRDLETFLGKTLPPNKLIGESWELSDRDNDMSVVDNGTHAGITFRSLLRADRPGIMGPLFARLFPDHFPLLVKYIDAHDIISLQVHPNDTYAMEHENGQWGKMEAWYIIHAAPHAYIIRGIMPGRGRDELLRMLEGSTSDGVLNRIPVAAEDVVFIPPGCLHATGPGVLLCEIQQNSDLTYRVTDWGRIEPTGEARELHLDKALDVIDFDLLAREETGIGAGVPAAGASTKPLIQCPKFEVDRVRLGAGEISPADVTERFNIVCVVDGSGFIVSPRAGTGPVPVTKGETWLIPSALRSYELTTQSRCTALRAFPPLPGE